MTEPERSTRSLDGTHHVQVPELTSSIRRLFVKTWSYAVSYRRKENRAMRRRRWLYLGSGVFSALVATSAYASLATSADNWAKWLVGTVSLVVVGLTVLNERGGYGADASESRAAADKYSALRDDAETLLNRYAAGSVDTSKAEEEFEKLQTRNGELNDKAPSVGRKEYEEANNWVIEQIERVG